MPQTKKHVRWVRYSRWFHRKISLALFIFFFIISLTGLLLGIKKETGLLAPTAKGTSTELNQWIPLSELTLRANRYLHDSVSKDLSTEIDRIDIRPGKGIAKFIYGGHYWGLQLDCTTGSLLSVEKRHSDFIENLHDGSIVDDLLGTPDEEFKVGYNILIGLSLIFLILSGLWLWYGPKRIRLLKRKQ